MAENVSRSEAMLAKILQNQRTILEQNKALLEERHQAREGEHERDSSNNKVPLIVQVDVSRVNVFCVSCIKKSWLIKVV